MNKIRKHAAKMSGALLLTFLLLIGNGATAQEGSALAMPENKAEVIKILALNEINQDLTKMTPEELAAALKMFRSMRVAKAVFIGDASMEKMLNGATKGAVGALGDPHTLYLDEKAYKELMLGTTGSFGGTGIVIGIKDKVLTVVAPIEGTPGEAAGVLGGDQILKIDGVDTADLSLDEAVNRIRGPKGTLVTLTIYRKGEAVKEYPITRATIQVKSVSGKMLDGGIGYLRISMFSERTDAELTSKLKELEEQGMKYTILDLRNNPGGLLEEGVKVAEHFVPQGPVVSVVTKDGTRTTYTSNLKNAPHPLAVLVNGGSASASEIVAGAIQDAKAGTLIGVKTYGKGSVQKVIPLDKETAVKVTIAKYLTPNERSINGMGLEPDVKVELPERQAESKEPVQDTQLDAAIMLLKNTEK